MRNITLLILCIIFYMTASAQQVSGLVIDEGKQPVAGASVAFRKAGDSSVVKYTTSDPKGKYSFAGIPAGTYFIQISHIGYADRFSPAVAVKDNTDINIPAISMSRGTDGLKAAEVVYHKPPIEVHSDKIVVNVEGSINAVGQDALELLRKSPGITVDKDNNISLSGKNGIKLYVDGREVPLNGSDLADYLKTIQSSQVESIEIISNPSARYDASGNAGIINIRLKKNKSFGNNGSVNGGYTIGTHSNYVGGLSLNHRDSHINWFGNYNYSNTANENHIELYRVQLDTLFNQKSYITPFISTHTFKTGLDYYLDKNNTLGLMVDGSISNFHNVSNSSTPISYQPDGELVRILQANNDARGKRNNGNLNLNYRHTDSLHRELSMDADYGIYRIRTDQYQPNIYFDPSGNSILYSDIYDMLAPTNIDIASFKTDYEQDYKGGRLGLGLKTSYTSSGNDFQQLDIFPTGKKMDSLNSSSFNYKENINAVYATYSHPFKGWALQAGLRVENTNSKGTSAGYQLLTDGYVPLDSEFTRHYTGFFPSGSVTYNKNPAKQWTLSYSRRIDRPAYQDLNPFEFKLDEYTFQKGNTNLQPQYTNSVGLTNVFKYRLTTTLNYSHVKDVFTQLVDTTDKSKAFISKENLATQDIVSLNISYPVQYKAYTLFMNVNTYYSMYKANFGAGRTVNLDVYAVNVFAQQSIGLGKGWTGEVSCFYTSPSIWEGTFKTKSLGNVDAGFQKTVLQKKGTIKLSVSDIFHTLNWSATSDFAGQYLHASGGNESRQLKLYFTYRFGNSQVKAARVHKSGAEDEGKRAKSSGGGFGN